MFLSLSTTSLLLLLLLAGARAVSGQRTLIPEEEAETIFELPQVQVRLLKEAGFAGFIVPKDRTGKVLEKYWAYLGITGFRELRCTKLNADGQPWTSCDKTFTAFVYNLTDPSSPRVKHAKHNVVEVFWPELGGPGGNFSFIVEGVAEEETRTFTNEYGKTRSIDVAANALKFSVKASNYTSRVLSDGEHYYDGTSGYFTVIALWIEAEMSAWIVPQDSFGQMFVPTMPAIFESTADQVVSYVNTVQDEFRVRISQATFSLNNPASASIKRFPEEPEEWGFEQLDFSLEGWNYTAADPYTSKFDFELRLVGGVDMLYDPDLSILLDLGDDYEDGEDGAIEDGADGNSGSASEGKKEDDSDDNSTAVIIAVSVVVPVIVLAAAAAIVTGIILKKRQQSANSQRMKRLSTMVSKEQIGTI